MNRIEVKSILQKKLGRPDVISASQMQYKCINPKCKSHRKGKKKFSVNLNTGQYNCWVCHLKGRNFSDLSNLLHIPSLAIQIGSKGVPEKKLIIPGYTLLEELREHHDAWKYMNARNNSEKTVIKYRIGYDHNRHGIFIPSYGLEGNINYWVVRYIKPLNDDMRYTASHIRKPVLFDDMLDFNREVIAVEGAFDELSVDYNATFFAGSFPSKAFIDRCKDYGTPVVLVYDGSAYDKALKCAASMASKGINTSYVKLPGHLDPNEMGNEVLQYIQKNKVQYSHKTYFINLLKERL